MIAQQPAPSENDRRQSAALQDALAASEGLRVIHARLMRLREEDPDEEPIPPSEYACRTVLTLLLKTQRLLGDMPRASVTGDEAGGLRVLWIGPQRQGRLVVPAESAGRHYVYYETGQSYDLVEAPGPTLLSERLRWFSGTDSS